MAAADDDREAFVVGSGDDCPHESLQRLGADGGANVYRHCPDCGSVVVEAQAGGVDHSGPDPQGPSRTDPVSSMLQSAGLSGGALGGGQGNSPPKSPLFAAVDHLRTKLEKVFKR